MLTLKLLQMYCYISNRQMQKGNVYNTKGFSRQRVGKIADVSETAFTCRLHYYMYAVNASLPVCSRSLQPPASSHIGRTLLSQLSSHPSEAAEPVSAVSPIVKGGSNRMRTRQYIKIRPLSL